MRNQIKKMINKEEGFTLVELLAVLVILGIIVAIAIPSIGSIIENAETNASDAETELVIDSARLYFVENDGSEVEVQTLIDDGYLENLSDDSSISKTSKVVYDSTNKEYNIE